MHLAPLSNEVIFKNAFSDEEVLEAFVKDVSGLDFHAHKIETERQFAEPIGGINIRYDIFAESEDGRVIVELQRVRYDTHFDRFLHYFLASIVEQAKSAKEYQIEKKVITIVVLTSPYKTRDLSGALIEDPVLVSDLDPRTLSGKYLPIFGHRLYFLNARYSLEGVPEPLQAWLRLVKASLDAPEVKDEEALRKLIGPGSPAVFRAAQRSLWDGLTPEQRTAVIESNEAEKAVATYIADLDEALRLKEVERRLKEEALSLKDEALRLKDEALRLKDDALAKADAMRQKLIDLGMDPEAL